MRDSSGQTIIELLVAMAFSLVLFPALFTMFYLSREGKAQQIQRTRAVSVAMEAVEALRSIREKGWDQFAVYGNGTSYRLSRSGSSWTLAGGTESVDGFSRNIVFSQVSRDASGAIVSSGGTNDPSTRRVTVTVSWMNPLPASVRYDSYLTRHSDLLQTDTTTADFSAGLTNRTRVVTLSDGEVILGSTGGYGDWCTPGLTIAAVDLPKSGVANAISAIQGQIAAGTGDNASGVSYANVLVNDPSFPTNPVASVSGTFDGYKTNDVFTESSYAYLATDTNSKEVEIIDLSSTNGLGKYNEAGYFNAPGNGDAQSVTTSGNVGYVVEGTKMYTFNLSSKSGSRPILDADGVTLPGTGKKIRVRGTRAFVVTTSTSAQLVIADVSNPSNLSISKQIALNGSGGTSLFVNATGTRAYVTTASNASKPELFIINTDTASAQYGQVISSYDTNGMAPKGVIVVSGPRAIVVGTGGEEYQVVDITNEQSLSRCGGLQVDSGINGIDTVLASSGRAYSYVITGDASSELKIIEGGPGANGSDYYLSGSFESQIFDAAAIATGSAEAAFNRISATVTLPSSQTDIGLQFAAADPVSGSCSTASYAYVGPDGTNATYFRSADGTSIRGSIPFSNDGAGYENPARCFRYRAELTTNDATLTPIISDVTISLSP